jgi:hypothetical protein
VTGVTDSFSALIFPWAAIRALAAVAASASGRHDIVVNQRDVRFPRVTPYLAMACLALPVSSQ